MDVIDLFCGTGGFSCGASQAGATVVLAVEADVRIAANYTNNFAHDLWVHELSEESVTSVIDRARAHPNAHVHGSPPCQKLSAANRTSYDTEEGLRLVRLYLDIVAAAQPRSWSMEQVNNPQLRELLSSRGVPFTIIDTSDFGVPQRRRRLVAGSPEIVQALRSHQGAGPTVLPRDVLDDLQPPERYSLVNGTDNQPIREKRDGKTVVVGLRRMADDENARGLDTPAHTVWGKPGKVYDVQERRLVRELTARECASLQGFPPDFRLDDRSKSRAHKVVGNAVPPPVAKFIAECAMSLRGAVS